MRRPDFVQIYSCGGTIDKVYFDASSQYEVGEPQIAQIFHRAHVNFEFAIESLMRKDSLEMTASDRAMVRQTLEISPHDHFLITHGTDTMPETARSLLGMSGNKIVVLTGSMSPARFEASDAEFNIGCAVGALMSARPGVYIAMNGQVFPADNVRKNLEARRFEYLR